MKESNSQLPKIRNGGGFSIVEVVIAVGIVTVGLVSILGVLLLGVDITNESSQRFGGIARLEEVFEDLRAVPANPQEGTLSPRFRIAFPAQGSSTVWTGYFSEAEQLATAENAVWAVDISISSPGSDQSGPFHIHGRARWPASATSGAENGSVHLSTAMAK